MMVWTEDGLLPEKPCVPEYPQKFTGPDLQWTDTWSTIQADEAKRKAGTGSLVLTGEGNGIQSSWLRTTNNIAPEDAAENTANIKHTGHIFGRFGQGPIDYIPDKAFSYLPATSKEHLVIFSIFPEKIDETGLTGSNEVVIEGNVKQFLTNT